MACNEGRSQVFGSIRAWNPDLIVTSDVEPGARRLASGARGADAQQEWQLGMTDSINLIGASGARNSVVLSPNPAGLSPTECATLSSVPADCISQISDDYILKSSAESAAASATGADYVDTRSWFCDMDGRCPAFIGDKLVRYDSAHLTSQFAEELVPLLKAKLVPKVAESLIQTVPDGVELPALLNQALDAVEWPVLSPTIDQAVRSGFPPADGKGCFPIVRDGKDCAAVARSDSSKLAMVVGDSIGVAWLPGIRAALEPLGWTIVDATLPGCPFVTGNPEGSNEAVMALCPDHLLAVADAVNRVKPALLITANRVGISSLTPRRE